MKIPQHPVEQEELMAYLDGELPAERAAWVAAHLGQCAECGAWAAESRTLSGRLMDWQVEPVPLGLTDRVLAASRAGAISAQPQQIPSIIPSRRGFFHLPRWAWATASAVCVLALIAISVQFASRRAPTAEIAGAPPEFPTANEQKVAVAEPEPPSASVDRMAAPAPAPDVATVDKSAPPAADGGGAESPGITAPMIVRTASLTLLTRDFDKTRAGIEDVVRRHHGYSGQLTVGNESGSGRKLSATFRIPADQLDAAIAEIKNLAHVDQESQGGEEVTAQFMDLTARLSNARRTEQTLLDMMEKRTGKLDEVLAVEQELSRVREEIEQMEAELKGLQNRVSFSTLQVELNEEYKAPLDLAPSLGSRLWNAVVEGARAAADSVVGLVLFLLNVGPFLLLWALLLFFPARYLWRRVRTARQAK